MLKDKFFIKIQISTIECDACQFGVAALSQLIKLNRSEEDIAKIAVGS